jgi:hypothetical protein
LLNNFGGDIRCCPNANAASNARKHITSNGFATNAKNTAQAKGKTVNDSFRQSLGNSRTKCGKFALNRTAFLDLPLAICAKKLRETCGCATNNRTQARADNGHNAADGSATKCASNTRGHRRKARAQGLTGSANILSDAFSLLKADALTLRQRFLSGLLAPNAAFTPEALKTLDARETASAFSR